MCIGDLIERIIHYTTIGFGKRIATKIANSLGFEDCGCSERQRKINEFFGCKQGIEL